MQHIFEQLYHALHSPAGLIVLLVLLLLGLWNMMRRPAGNLSQRLMRWRVGLQFGVICVIVLVALYRAFAR